MTCSKALEHGQSPFRVDQNGTEAISTSVLTLQRHKYELNNRFKIESERKCARERGRERKCRVRERKCRVREKERERKRLSKGLEREIERQREIKKEREIHFFIVSYKATLFSSVGVLSGLEFLCDVPTSHLPQSLPSTRLLQRKACINTNNKHNFSEFFKTILYAGCYDTDIKKNNLFRLINTGKLYSQFITVSIGH